MQSSRNGGRSLEKIEIYGEEKVIGAVHFIS